MSDYIDELVEQFVPSCRATGNDHSPGSCCECIAHESADTFARAVAERVRERARVWILVSERLPEDGDLVLSLDKHGHVRVEPGANSNDFTHWQPLPPPPGRAVAERVRASAWVCSWCHGSGLHPGPYDDVPTCDRCAGRGVTFGGEA